MNPEAIQHRTAVIEARGNFANGKITQDELNDVVDKYIAFMASKVGKAKAKRFTRSYILRAL